MNYIRAGVLPSLTPSSVSGLNGVYASSMVLSCVTCTKVWLCSLLFLALGLLAFTLTTETTAQNAPEETEAVTFETSSVYALACITPSLVTWS